MACGESSALAEEVWLSARKNISQYSKVTSLDYNFICLSFPVVKKVSYAQTVLSYAAVSH